MSITLYQAHIESPWSFLQLEISKIDFVFKSPSNRTYYSIFTLNARTTEKELIQDTNTLARIITHKLRIRYNFYWKKPTAVATHTKPLTDQVQLKVAWRDPENKNAKYRYSHRDSLV